MIRDVLDDLFSKKFLDDHLDEWGIVEHCDHPTSLGYSTTITPRTIYEAVDRSVDVIVTHHDAWKSHNYTELPGVEMFAYRLCSSLKLEMKGHLGDAHF